MKPAWDKLMKKFKNSKTVLVGDADCTGDGESLCQEIGVQGYPTIKYGDPSALEDYNGGRDFDELKKFTDELKPSCSPSNIDLCDADAKKKIEDLQALSDDDLDAKIEEKEKESAAAEETFKSEVEKLQATYEKLSKEKDEAIKAVKESGLGLMKAVKAGKKKKKEEL
jgi:hypothetical protein